MNPRKMGVVLSYIYILIQTITNFMYIPLLLGFMGTSEFGLYQLMGSIIAYFSIMNFGLSTVITRFYSNYNALGDEKGKENVISLSIIIYTCLSLITVVLAVILYSQLDWIFGASLTKDELYSAKWIFIILVFNLVITLMTNVFEAVINANERFVFLRLLAILQTVIQPFIVIMIMNVSPYAMSLVAVQSIVLISFISIKVFYCFIKLKIKFKYHSFDTKLFSEMFLLSSSVFIVTIADQVLWRSNQIILGIISGTTAVSVYAIATQIYTSYMSISTVFSGIFLPKITKMVAISENEEKFSNIFIRIGRIQFFILACILSGFILFGQEFILIWAGEEFKNTYWIAIIIMIPFTIDLIQNIGIVIMQAKNKYSFRAKIMIITALVNISIAIPLLNYFGDIGGAIATAFSIFIGNGLIMNWYFTKNLKINIRKFWAEIGKIFIIVCLSIMIGVFLSNIYIVQNQILNLILKILIYLIIYCFLCWIFAMNEYEKGIINKPIKKIFDKKAY